MVNKQVYKLGIRNLYMQKMKRVINRLFPVSIRFSQKQTRASLMSLGITVLILPNSEVSVTSYFFYWCYP